MCSAMSWHFLPDGCQFTGSRLARYWQERGNLLKTNEKEDCTTKAPTLFENIVQKQPLAVACSVLRCVCKNFEEQSDETADPGQQALAKPGLDPDAKRWVYSSQEAEHREASPTGVAVGADAIGCVRPKHDGTRRVTVSSGSVFRADVRNAQRAGKQAARSATLSFPVKDTRQVVAALCVALFDLYHHPALAWETSRSFPPRSSQETDHVPARPPASKGWDFAALSHPQ